MMLRGSKVGAWLKNTHGTRQLSAIGLTEMKTRQNSQGPSKDGSLTLHTLSNPFRRRQHITLLQNPCPSIQAGSSSLFFFTRHCCYLNKWEETLNTFDTMISHFEGRTNMRGLPFIGMRRLFTQLQTCLVVLLIFILWRRISPIFLKPNSELSLIDQWRFPNDTPKIRRSLPRHPVDSSFTIRRRIAEPASTLIDSNHNHPPCQPPTIPQEAREGQISFSTITKPKGCLSFRSLESTKRRSPGMPTFRK